MYDTAISFLRTWTQTRLHNKEFIVNLESLLRDSKIEPAKIDMFAVGIGPGIFSSLRVALSTVRAMALPGNKQVVGIKSPDALALAVFIKTGEKSISVIGDARRNKIWCADYEFQDGILPIKHSLNIYVPADFTPEGKTAVSCDWDRLPELKKKLESRGIKTVFDPYPTAKYISLLALEKIKTNAALDPLSPVYLHPAV